MSVLDTPAWLQQYVEKWQERLYLQQWRIRVYLALVPNNDTNALAVCETVSNIRSAKLTFRADIEQNKESEETIIHEVLHISHAFSDMAIWSSLGHVSNEIDRNMAYQAYTNEMERFVDGMSKILWAMDQPQPARLELKDGDTSSLDTE
jgi:hypothetical protein